MVDRYYIDHSEWEDYGVVRIVDRQSDWHWTIDSMGEARVLVDRLNEGQPPVELTGSDFDRLVYWIAEKTHEAYDAIGNANRDKNIEKNALIIRNALEDWKQDMERGRNVVRRIARALETGLKKEVSDE